MLEGGFVAKASSLKTRPSLLYLEAQINGQNISCLVPIRGIFSMSSMLIHELDFKTHRADMPSKIFFAKNKPYVINEVALHMTLNSGGALYIMFENHMHS